MRRPAIMRVRRMAGLAAVGAVVVAVGLVSGAGPAIGAQAAAATWSYSCMFPSGAQPVDVAVSATFPGMASPGTAIQPTDVAITATLPAAAVSDLRSLGANSTTASAALAMTVTQNGAQVPTRWPSLLSPDTVLPAEGTAALAFSGTVPAATATDTGDVTFTADALALQFTPTTVAGTATTPNAVAVDCGPTAGQHTVFATVPVPAPPISAAPPPTGTAPVIGTQSSRSAAPQAITPKATDPTQPPNGPDCQTSSPPGLLTLTALVAGRTNLNKLHESVSLGGSDPIALDNVGSGINAQGDFVLCWTAQLTLPPQVSTVLAFGFEPTTATMTLRQDGTMIVENWQHDGTPMASVVGQENLTLSNVRVNGQALDVGSHCRSATPVAINMTGVPPYQPLTGGPLEGELTIPPVTGCGTTENLDPLLTAVLSGPDNLIRIIQGAPCSNFIPDCVPEPPVFQ